ncbi:MAG: arginine--tRNA ligase [Clostridia bacterium]|nr:arginine--tRNA ligase [Clostridia bacterium]
MQTFKDYIAEKISASLPGLFGGAVIPDGELRELIEYPPDASMGDLALPCFKLSRTLRRSPVQIALALAGAFDGDSKVKAAALNGYLNFTVDNAALAEGVLGEVLSKGERYGSPENGHGKTVVLDYSSPNVAKPFHIGHLGTTVIGHSLKKLHEFAGYKCVGINYLGDWGTQFGKMICAYKKWGNRDEIEAGGVDRLVELYVRINNAIEAEKAEGKTALADESRAEFHNLELGDKDNIALWKWFVEISLNEYSKTYRQLDIEFDSYAGESFYTDKMPAQVEKLRQMGLLKIDDGASIVDLGEYGMPPCLILKKDGSTLYPTRDIAAANYRYETYHFDKAIYVTSAAQSLHFAQWFKVVELMGYDWSKNLVHVPYGTVSINGAKLATRTGNVILLRDLFSQAIEKVDAITAEKNPGMSDEKRAEIAEAVGVGAVVFYYLSNNRIKDINFMLEDALSYEGNTGPYVQYTYARSCSVLEKSEGVSPVTKYRITTDDEHELLKVLAQFPERVSAAIEAYEPSYITRYILDLAAAFNRFYHNCQILTADDPETVAARIAETKAVNTVLGTAFGLICLKKTTQI